MVPAYILYLREGLEGSMIVSILLAAVQQLGHAREQVRAIWVGTGLALLLSAIGGAILFISVREYDGTTLQTVIETVAYLVAVVLLTSMTFWVQRHSRTLKQDLTSAAASTGGSLLALGLLAFTSVGREAVESAVFTLAFAFKANGWLLLLGGLLGIACSTALAFAIYRLGRRLDYRLFFRVMGLLLLLFAAGLLGDAVQNMQELGWITFGASHLWSTAHLLSEESWLGDLLHGFIGYAESPTVLQAVLYVAFLATAGMAFFRVTRRPLPPRSTQQAETRPSGALG